MGLIKSSNTPATLSPFSMSDIESQANAVIMRAKNQAGRILVEAQRIAEELKKQSHDEGLVEGKQEGLEQGLAEGRAAGQLAALNEQREALAKLIESLSTAAADLNASRRLLEAEACTDVMKLAIAIARRGSKQLGETSTSVVTDNVREAMKLCVRASDVRIAVNPSQKQSLEATLPQLKMDWPALEHVAIIEDATLAPGGCRIFTAGGQIDADLDEQIN